MFARLRRAAGSLAFWLICVLAISIFAKYELFRNFVIPSESMVPTLAIDEHIAVFPLAKQLNQIKRGDIVVFRDPGGWMPLVQDNNKDVLAQAFDWIALWTTGDNLLDRGYLVKRVIGVAGDTVSCCSANGKLTINGHALDETYLSAASKSASDVAFKVKVPNGAFWVMGDNRPNSADSRFHRDLASKGFVKRDYIIGVVFAKDWPLSSFKWLARSADGVFSKLK